VIESVLLHHVSDKAHPQIGPLAEYNATPDELESYLHSRTEWESVSAENGLGPVQNDLRFLLTFDDGYRNYLTEALPVLEKHETPSILFITTSFVEGTAYPYELELAEVLEHSEILQVPGRNEPVTFSATAERRGPYQNLRLPLKPASYEKREAFMEQLAEQNGYDRSEMQSEPLLSWEEVRALSEHPLVTIGAHTQSHTLLSRQPWRVVLEELRTAKHRLEEQIGQSVSVVSYPYGGNNVVIRQMARWVGFDYGFTTEARRANHVTAWNRLALPRIDISELVPDDE